MYKRFIKRALDIACALAALVVLLPVLLIIYILVRVQMGNPVIFCQERIGLHEKEFKMYKFRSMTNERDENGELLPATQRLTKFGRFLRSASLDELPELINILKGDMSVVGPRALLHSYLPYYTDQERQRHCVRPGLTPPEVLYGNVTPTWDEQFTYEVDYANNLTFLLDVKIVFATIKGLFQRNHIHYGSYMRQPLYKERAEMSAAEEAAR